MPIGLLLSCVRQVAVLCVCSNCSWRCVVLLRRYKLAGKCTAAWRVHHAVPLCLQAQNKTFEDYYGQVTLEAVEGVEALKATGCGPAAKATCIGRCRVHA